MVGVHVTQLFSFPGGDPAELVGLSDGDQAGMAVLAWFWQDKGAFNVLQGQQPQTLAHAISDSPAGLLDWHGQLFDDTLDDEFILANVSLHWLTGMAGTSIRHYYEDTHALPAAETGPTTSPLGLAAAESGDFRSIRRFAERDHARITSWTQTAWRGGPLQCPYPPRPTRHRYPPVLSPPPAGRVDRMRRTRQ